VTTIAVTEADQDAVVLGVQVVARALRRSQLGDRFDITVSQGIDFCATAESRLLPHLLLIDANSQEM